MRFLSILIALGFILAGFQIVTNVSAHNKLATHYFICDTHTQLDTTYYARNTGANPYYDYIDDIAVNGIDYNSTYIYNIKTTGYSAMYFPIYPIDAEWYALAEGDSIVVEMFMIWMLNASVVATQANQIHIICQKDITNYATSIVDRMGFPLAKQVWYNTTYTISQCPWTGLNWTVDDFNTTQFIKIWTNGFPNSWWRITAVGLKMTYLTPVIETDFNLIYMGGIAIGLIGVLFFIMLRKDKDD